MDILGPVSDDNLFSLKTKAFYEKQLTFVGACKPSTSKIVMKVNPGK